MSINEEFPSGDPIWGVSDPALVRKKYAELYGDEIVSIRERTGEISKINRSTRQFKKYMVFDGKRMIHFGDVRYEDYTHHKDQKRWESYHSRFRENPLYGKYTPYVLSKILLW